MSKPKLIANLGDVNPFEYGGCFVYSDGSIIEFNLDEDAEDQYIVQCYEASEDPSDFSEGWIQGTACFIGSTIREIESDLLSGDIVKRAMATRDLDSYLSIAESEIWPGGELRRRFGSSYAAFKKREKKSQSLPKPVQWDIRGDFPFSVIPKL